MKAIGRILSFGYRWLLQPALVVAIIVGGVWGAKRIGALRPQEKKVERPIYAPLVRAEPVRIGDAPVVIRGNGTVHARTQVMLASQVSGKVVSIHKNLRAGGTFQAGEPLVVIEKSDFELAVKRAKANITSAQTNLDVRKAEAKAARDEWESLNPGTEPPALVARLPQIRAAEAAVAAAETALKDAELALGRTTIQLPFAGRVVAESVDVGQVVSPSMMLATIHGTDALEIPVPLATDELGWIRLPGENGPEGSSVEIQARIAGAPLTLAGRVTRIEGEIDSTTRMAKVVVTVDADSLNARARTRVLPGLFCDVAIRAGELKGVARIARASVRDGGKVWVVQNGALRIVAPEVVRAEERELLVRGLEDGALVVTSDLEVVTDGMKVRVAKQEQ
ncbi:MAG: efflux RND transporter periplasmic adaptor subunit [Planctomycetota bacterium]|nr:efflux RND transporter periplasmic adaptor subunit [Planctomycetota bacterium]